MCHERADSGLVSLDECKLRRVRPSDFLAARMEETLTLALNLMGTFAFGLSGGILAVRKQMDLFGVLVLSVATALGGGIMRDTLPGHSPRATRSDWRAPGSGGSAALWVGL